MSGKPQRKGKKKEQQQVLPDRTAPANNEASGSGTGPSLPVPPEASTPVNPGIYLASSVPAKPDDNITKAENALVLLTAGQDFNGFTGRRGYGTQGATEVLRTNYLVVKKQSKASVVWYRYHMEFRPDVNKEKKRRLIDLLISRSEFEGIVYASDYAQTLLTTQELKFTGAEWKLTLVVPPQVDSVPTTAPTSAPTPASAEGDQGPPPAFVAAARPPPAFVAAARKRNEVIVNITRTGTFGLDDLLKYLNSPSKDAHYENREEVIQLLNIIITKSPNLNPFVKSLGGNKFYPFEGASTVQRQALGGGLQAHRGYYSSVRPAVNRLLLNINVTSGAFYMPIGLEALLKEFKGVQTVEQRERNYVINDAVVRMIKDDSSEMFIRMLKVKVKYCKAGQTQPFMEKVKTVVGYARPTEKAKVTRFGDADQILFKYKDATRPNAPEQDISIANYFLRQHGIKLNKPKLPVLNVGTRADPQYLPMELCTVLPGQPYSRLLGAEQTTQMIHFAARPPNANALSIAGTPSAPGTALRLFNLKNGAGDVQATSVGPFGFQVEVDLLTVPGRILSVPSIKYGGPQPVKPFNGAWNLANQRFIRPGKLQQWTVLVLQVGRPSAPREEDVLAFHKVLKEYGITMGNRMQTRIVDLQQLTPANRGKNDTIISEFFALCVTRQVEFVLVMLPMADKWLYSRVKFFADVKYGIHTVSCIHSKFGKPNGQQMYFANLALKVNIKSGGVNHDIPDTLNHPLSKNTMLMGIDVTHPSPGSVKEAPSIASVVASIDPFLGAWPGSVRCQKGKQEMVSGLEEMVKERLNLWLKKNRRYPDKIVLYRDGVSEGQYATVLNEELPSFYAAFKALMGAKNMWPKLTVIIVGKRHHTRFYPTDVKGADVDPRGNRGTYNPKPGTIVDRHIGGRILREFWLQAHAGLQGSARPAHYVVLKDEIGIPADAMEKFTHQLCYLFNRTTKAVSICPPAYYADLLCERGRAYLYTTMGENPGGDAGTYDTLHAEWHQGVHPNLAESTWYI
nr:protein argonaute mel1 [Quercus suber]